MSHHKHSAIPDGSEKIRKITWVGLFVNVFLFMLKFSLGVLGRSQAVIADAVHSLSDLSTDFAVIFGAKFWMKPADESHPYGHKRIESIVTTFIGLILFVAGIKIGYDSIVNVKGFYSEQPAAIALFGALFSIVVKEIIYRLTIRVGKKEGSSAVVANAWHHRVDAFSSIPVLFAVGVAVISNKWAFLDNLAALVVSVFILYSAGKIIKPIFLEILGTAAPRELRDKIYNTALDTDGVKSIHALRTRKMGSDWYVDLHIQVNPEITVRRGHDISEHVKKNIVRTNKKIIDVIVHLEPYE